MIERVQSFGAELKIELLVESNGPVKAGIDIEVAGSPDLVPSCRSESRTVFSCISGGIEIAEQSRIQTGDWCSRLKIVVDGDGWLDERGVLTAAARQQIRRRVLGHVDRRPTLNAHGAVHLPVTKNALRNPLLK